MKTRDVTFWNNILEGLAKLNRPSSALRVLSKMVAIGVQPSVRTYPTLLKVCRTSCLVSLGFSITTHIIVRGLDKDIVCCDALFHFHARCGEIAYARSLFESMESKPKSVWLALMSGYANRRSMPMCVSIFDSMPISMKLSNADAWNVLFRGFVKEFDYHACLRLYDIMGKAGVLPDDTTAVFIWSTCISLGKWDTGRELYLSTQKYPTIKYTPVFNNSCINFLIKSGDLNEALYVFHRMKLKNLITYNSIIMGCSLNYETDLALEIFKGMKLQPDHITFTNLLNGLSLSGRVDECLTYFRMMTDRYNIEPNATHRGIILSLLLSTGHLEEVLKFAKSFETSNHVWMSILSMCSIQTNVKVAECVFEELERREVTEAAHLVTMANLYASVGDYSRSEQMRALMKQRGLNKKPAFSSVLRQFGTKKEFSTVAANDPLFEGNKLHDLQVESEVIKLRESRSGSSSKSEAQDMAISVFRLRAELQNAIQSENYSLAAQLRDEISKLEAKSLTASVKAQAYENAQYNFRLGQKVKHKIFGYRAVICGMDPVCGESKSWIDGANVEKLTRGPDQSFYQVLVDVHEDPNLLVAYVPEENLVVTDQQDMDRFDHPYASFLFYGVDAALYYIPIKQLREKYNQPRHELPYDPNDEQDRKDS